jgi:hypothetical protein
MEAQHGPKTIGRRPLQGSAETGRADHAVVRTGWPPRRLSYDHERDSRSQNDQCIYASDHDAEINVGHEPLRLELGFPTEHRASPSAWIKQKTGIRSEETFKSIPMYLVPKPFDQVLQNVKRDVLVRCEAAGKRWRRSADHRGR